MASSSVASAIGRHIWTPDQDKALIACMLELQSTGHFNADSGFKSGYLSPLEKMLAKKLPGCGIKAKPHIESRLRTLKKEWIIVFDMIHGKHTSGFGWDDNRKMVTAEDDVWEAYLQSHKEASTFRTRCFQYFGELTQIYAKDRAKGRDSQTVQEVLAEAENEDIPYVDMDESEPNHSVAADHVTSTQNTSNSGNQGPSSNSKSTGKRKRNNDNIEKMLDGMHEMGLLLAKSMNTDSVQEKLPQLDDALRSLDGITREEIGKAHIMFSKNHNLVLTFFGMQPANRLDWLRVLLQCS